MQMQGSEERTMASSGIRNQVAIIGMGCTRFGELWDKGIDDLLTDAATEAATSAGVSIHDIDAFWLGTMTSAVCGVSLSRPLKLDYKPVTRVENYCATGSEAFRNDCYAVGSGAYDTAMAIGVEKLKDTGYSGLTGIRPVGDGTDPGLSSPAAFSFLAPSYGHKYGVDAHKYCDNPLYVKALSFVAGPAAGPIDPGYDYTTFEEVVRSAADAYAQA